MSMTKYEKADRKFQREFSKLERMRRCIEAGRADHMFANEETKAYVLADIEADQIKLVRALLEQFPGMFKQYPDGKWCLVDNNIVPFRS